MQTFFIIIFFILIFIMLLISFLDSLGFGSNVSFWDSPTKKPFKEYQCQTKRRYKKLGYKYYPPGNDW